MEIHLEDYKEHFDVFQTLIENKTVYGMLTFQTWLYLIATNQQKMNKVDLEAFQVELYPVHQQWNMYNLNEKIII
jgi:hypothetical protein